MGECMHACVHACACACLCEHVCICVCFPIISYIPLFLLVPIMESGHNTKEYFNLLKSNNYYLDILDNKQNYYIHTTNLVVNYTFWIFFTSSFYTFCHHALKICTVMTNLTIVTHQFELDAALAKYVHNTTLHLKYREWPWLPSKKA